MTEYRTPKYCRRCRMRLDNIIQGSMYDSYTGEAITVDADRLMCPDRHVEWRVNSEGVWFLWSEIGTIDEGVEIQGTD